MVINSDGDFMSEIVSREDGQVTIEQWEDDYDPPKKVHYSLDDCKRLIKFLQEHIAENGD